MKGFSNKNLMADPLHQPAFQILTLWCYKIASSSLLDPIMSRYNEASVQVHCSPLFGVFWGLCGHLSAPEEFGGLSIGCSLTVDSDSHADSYTISTKEGKVRNKR